MSGWYYLKEGIFDDKEVGPISDATLLQMAFDGDLKRKSKVRHEQHTGNQLAFLEQVPAAKAKIEAGETLRAEQARLSRAEKDQRKQEAAAEKAAQKRQRDEDKFQERLRDEKLREAAALAEEARQKMIAAQRTTQPQVSPGPHVVIRPAPTVASHAPLRGTVVESEVLSCRPAMFANQPIMFLICLCLVPFGIGLLILGLWWLSVLNTRLSVTTKRTVLRRGLLSKHTTEVRHDDVRNLQVSQSFMQRLFGVGSLAVSSAAQGVVEIYVSGIPNPQHIKETINGYRP